MTTLIPLVAAVWVTGMAFVVALCCAAARGDEPLLRPPGADAGGAVPLLRVVLAR